MDAGGLLIAFVGFSVLWVVVFTAVRGAIVSAMRVVDNERKAHTEKRDRES